jgi:hypothetical protein
MALPTRFATHQAIQENTQQRQKLNVSSLQRTAADAIKQGTNISVVRFSLDVLVNFVLLDLRLLYLALLASAGGGGLLVHGLGLALLRGLRSVLSVWRSAGSLARHGDVVLCGETGVALGPDTRLVT